MIAPRRFASLGRSAAQALSISSVVLLSAVAQTAQAQRSPAVRPALSLAAALSAALSGNSSVLLARTQEEVAQGAVQTARGIFDLTLNAQGGTTRTNSPLGLSQRNAYLLNGFDLRYNLTDTTVTQAGATQLFSNGLQANLVATQTTNMSNLYPVSAIPRQNIQQHRWRGKSDARVSLGGGADGRS